MSTSRVTAMILINEDTYLSKLALLKPFSNYNACKLEVVSLLTIDFYLVFRHYFVIVCHIRMSLLCYYWERFYFRQENANYTHNFRILKHKLLEWANFYTTVFYLQSSLPTLLDASYPSTKSYSTRTVPCGTDVEPKRETSLRYGTVRFRTREILMQK